MDEKRYYDFLNKLEEPNRKDGWVLLDKIPYKDCSDAIWFCMSHFPEAEPKDKPIVHDPQRAKEISAISAYIVIELKERLDSLRDGLREKIDAARAEVERLKAINKPHDIKTEVELHTREETLRELSFEYIGVGMAWQVLHHRQFELLGLAKDSYPSEWRF